MENVGKSLAEMRAERDVLDAEIRKAEQHYRSNWNTGLDALDIELSKAKSLVENVSNRKNETIYELRGGGQVRLGYLERDWGAWLTVESGDGYELSWDTSRGAPDPARFMALVRMLAYGG